MIICNYTYVQLYACMHVCKLYSTYERMGACIYALHARTYCKGGRMHRCTSVLYGCIDNTWFCL